jgi:DNA-binding CsgD family transcriptional regulator
MIEGYRGNRRIVDAIGLEAESVLLSVGVSFSLAVLQLSRGLAALSDGRPGEAADHLRRIFDPVDVAFHPVIRGWAIGDLAEAYALLGQPELVAPFLVELRLSADSPSTTYSAAVYRYAEALTASDEDRGRLLHGCLEVDHAWTLHRARVQLALGTWLRRHRRPQESRAPLRAARNTFDALGANPWSERARVELRAAGEVSAPRTVGTLDSLTPQELQIAELAAAGYSNREIGARLYLSHRTVASHLYRVFPKLGVVSRARLREALATQAQP